MAISTYSELVSTVKDLLALPDAPVATFVSQAEADFRSIRHRFMETQRRVSMAANVGSIALPSDFVELKAISLNGALLRRMSRYAEGNIDPNSYHIVGTSIMVRPVQTGGTKLLLTYYAKIPALSDSTASNWLLEEFPMVYLNATMAYAYQYLRDAEGEAAANARFNQSLAQLADDDRRSLNGGNTPVWPR